MVRVERLLADCLDDVRAHPLGTVPLTAEGPAYAAARRTFLTVGLEALRAHAPEAGWVQLNLAVTPPPYGRLAAAAEELLGTGRARGFFFMHKPAGLRVRFLAAEPSRVPELRAALLRRLTPERTEDAGTRPMAGVYEPEIYLFGGPRSMPWVHELFTADSRAWLDVHTAAAGDPAPAGWRVSLALLHAVFDGLGIVGSEHRGVWHSSTVPPGTPTPPSGSPRRPGRWPTGWAPRSCRTLRWRPPTGEPYWPCG
ncbi:thiopeptide-type bacteriocin biosynthesis protein, partial [Streptomyces sp. RM1]